MPSWKKYSVLLRRVRRNREDGWAWRDLAFTAIYDYDGADDRTRQRLERRIAHFIQECDRTAPEDAATLRVHAQWREARGEWQQATEGWLESIDHDPASTYSYRHAWECSARLDDEQRCKVWSRMEAMLLAHPGRLSAAREIITLAARRFGVAAAEKAASSWAKLRPDDPEVLEASVDLLLDYGLGRTDAERALVMLKPACEHFPYHVGLRFSLADALRKLGRFADAEEVLGEILRRHPDNSSAKIQLAWVHQRHGRLDEGLEVLVAAAAQDPRNTQISDAKVQMLMTGGRFEEARSAISENLQRFPESVHWRERAIRLLMECGDADAAVRAAREGVVMYPRGAYLWLLLGRTLNEFRRFAAQGEIESCFRRSLALNQGLFETADQLAILLCEQRRYAEAEEIMLQIQKRLGDPFPAQGRLAWIHREQGLRREALDEMSTLVEAAPWYLWGWRVLMGWLVEDEAWEKAQNLLGAISPELHTLTQFRRQRLEVLEQAGLATEKLDQEWSSLLHDFPEDVSLHLLRYDSLHRAQRTAEAAVVLDLIRPIDPESPYILARLVEVLAEKQQKEKAVDALLRVFFAETEESTWPATYAWNVVKNARFEEDAYRRARGLLEKKERPTPRALSIMASHAMQRGRSPKRTVQPPVRAWFPDAGAREVLALLGLVDAVPRIAGRYRAILFRQLSDFGYQQLVVKDWKKHKDGVEADADTWSETARALVALKRTKQARQFLAQWRERAGVGMWVVANYVMCFSALRKKELQEIFSSCRDALAGLPHDHCAKYLVHLEAEACALLGDRNGFLKTWNEHREYFDGKVEDNEWFESKRRHLLTDLPTMARFLEQNEERLYRKAERSLRWKHRFSLPQIQGSSQKKGNANLRWWWIVIVLLWLLMLLLRNSQN
jgi:predicted Zn-dependent protease